HEMHASYSVSVVTVPAISPTDGFEPTATLTNPVVSPSLASDFCVLPLTCRLNFPVSPGNGNRSFVTVTRGLRLFVIVQSTTAPASSVPSESGPELLDDALLSPGHEIEAS